MTLEPSDLASTVERFSGFAALYETYRPQPPVVLLDILTQRAGIEQPQLVVDLGCGTGLSTRIWADRAKRVIGIEPGADMRHQAEIWTSADNVFYQAGYSHETGLPDACADIVTCSQALHWMEPAATFVEVARILRPGGVFAAYDCDWPPTTSHWEAEVADAEFQKQVGALEREHGFSAGVKRWAKDQHLDRMKASGYFRYVKEIAVHQVELGNAERLVGLALSQGSTQTLLKHGMTEAEIGLDRLRAVAKRTLGDEPQPWYFSYRVRLGIV